MMNHAQKRTLSILCAASCAIFTPGCAALGTRMVGGYTPPYFSGVRADASFVVDREQKDRAASAVDLPFSLVGDVLFLPLDAFTAWEMGKSAKHP
jgi:uncharacterized protein YceK